MNKKVLTLCAAMLLSGSSLVYASDYVNKWTWDWQTELSEFTTGKPVTLSEDGLTMTVNGDVVYLDQRNFLLIDKDNFVLDGNNHVWKGRIVITGENVTIKNFKNIDYENVMVYGATGEDGTVIENKSAITVFAGSVNIENNIITVSSTSADDNHVANGITIYPTSATPKYNITGNTILNANEIAAGDETWPASPAFGIEIIGNISGGTDNGYTYFESKSGKSSVTITDFSGINLEGTTVENSATDYAYIEASGKIPSETKDGDVYKVVEIEANENNAEAIKKALKNAADNATIKFDGTSEQLATILGDTEVTADVAVQCAGDETNVLFGTPDKVENGWPSEFKGMADATWGDYVNMQADGTKDNVVLIIDGYAVKAIQDEDGNVTYSLGEYLPSSTDENNLPSQYHFTLTPYEYAPGKYELRIKDSYGKWFEVGNDFVTVANVAVTKGTKGEWLFNGEALGNNNVVFPTGLELMSGSEFVVIESNELTTSTNVADAQKFGTAKISQAFMYAEDLLNRFGEYFTLGVTYITKDEYGNDVEVDLTSIFEGELTPVQWNGTGYYAGEAWYRKAYDNENKFMLINENNMILALNTNPKTGWSSGTDIHAYKLELITPKQYAEDTEKYYRTTFTIEYTPGNDAATTTEITNVYVQDNGRLIPIGCYLDGQTPVLAGKGSASIQEVEFTLNASAVVDASKWLTTPSYYTVEVANKNTKSSLYGKVLGLNEYGNVAYVAPTKTDIEKPEGQFAIKYEAGKYILTNRENHATYELRGSDLYNAGTTNVFAYRSSNSMDTLKITPVTQYTSADGFRRIPTADLNANTYEIALNTIAGPLYVIENHNDKHRIGLDTEEATAWRIEQPTVKVMDVTGDLDHYAADTVSVWTPITYWADNDWRTTQITNPKGKYYAPNTELLIPTYILKNTATDEYMRGTNDIEEAGNNYYFCDEDDAVRLALKEVGDSTVVLIPAFHTDMVYWYDDIKKTEGREYDDYAADLRLIEYKIIGGTTDVDGKGVLKADNRYEATSNDLFVISETGARTYKLLNQDDKIAISLMENNDEVIYEDGAFANIDNDQAYDINPTLYVDTAYINRPGNYRYDYLLSVRPLRVDSIESCNNPNHEHPRTTFTEGDFLVVMRDSMDANKDVHNNIYAYNEQPRLAFVPGIHQNDTLYYTDAAGKIIDKEEVGNAKYSFAKFAFKMIDEANNEFVIETAYDYTPVKWVNGEPVEYEVSKGYLRWDNSFLVVTPNLDDAEHFTMEASELNATANEEISAENSAVSVVATDGAVVIKGAAGKNVVIATILGKVVANETVNSDNETIVVPAGIAVVSVDGESFKVVVK